MSDLAQAPASIAEVSAWARQETEAGVTSLVVLSVRDHGDRSEVRSLAWAATDDLVMAACELLTRVRTRVEHGATCSFSLRELDAAVAALWAEREELLR